MSGRINRRGETTHRWALGLHHAAIRLDSDIADLELLDARVIALLLAAVWIATEGATHPPWSPVALAPRRGMTRTQFLVWAAQIFDGWTCVRPARRLALISSNQTKESPSKK